MKKLTLIVIFFSSILVVFSQKTTNKKLLIQQIAQTEKAFEKMAFDKGITAAFYFYADSNAVINRGKDSLIYGKDNIRNFYEKKNYTNATVNWTPDFIDISEDGTMAYTYGKYVWRVKQNDGNFKEFHGVFHTVWKRQVDNTWKYVWD
jgi:ketosteroid isomerase-like protein